MSPPTPPRRPHLGRNALDAAVLGYVNVAALRQHIRPDERMHGDVPRGRRQAQHRARGTPRRTGTCARGTVERLEALKARVVACLEAGAMAAGCAMDLQWVDPPYADMVDDDRLLGAVPAQRWPRSAGRSRTPQWSARSWAAPTWATSATSCRPSTPWSPSPRRVCPSTRPSSPPRPGARGRSCRDRRRQGAGGHDHRLLARSARDRSIDRQGRASPRPLGQRHLESSPS